MFFRIKLSLFIFSLMFVAISLKGNWTNLSGGVFYINPGGTISLYGTVRCDGSCNGWDAPDFLRHTTWPGCLDYDGGRYQGESSDDGAILTLVGASVWAKNWIGVKRTSVLYPKHESTYIYPPAYTIISTPGQIPERGPDESPEAGGGPGADESPQSGEPISDRDGTFDLKSRDISSEKPNGVNLTRTYRSREGDIYFEDDQDYKNLLLPFSEGGWTHNYIKSIIITEEDSDIYYRIRDGNAIRDVRYIDEDGNGSIDDFADNYKVHNGLVEINDNQWKYIKSDGTIEFYSRSSINDKAALVDSIEQFDEITFRFGYDEGDTLDYVEDKWGDSVKFYYEIYNSVSLLNKVEISGRDEWIEYKYKEFNSLNGEPLNPSHYFHRLSQIIKHTGEDEIIVLDRYYYNRDLDPDTETGMDCKSDIVTQVFPQGEYDEDNDTSQTAYNNHQTSGYRLNNWYGKYGIEGVYYQEVVSGDTILEKIYIERFYHDEYDNRVDSVWVYHMENLKEPGEAHDPNDTEFTPTAPGAGEDYYLEIRRYNLIGTLASVTIRDKDATQVKTTTYLSYDSDYNPLEIEKPNGDTVRYEYYQYTANGTTRYSSYPTKIVYPGGDSVLNYYSQPDPTNNPYYIRLESTVDEMGRETEYTYDANNYTDEITLADRYVAGEGVTDVITDYDYNAAGNLLQVIDPEGVITYYEYSDNDNGPFLFKSGVDVGGDENQSNDILTFYSYNDIGEIERKIEARVNPFIMDTTEYEYDVMGKLSKIIHPNSDYEEFVYDKAGNLLQKKSLDTLGNSVITHEYKSYPSGKLREVEENEGAGYTTEYDYNQDGKLVEFTNAHDKTIDYNYNKNKLVSTHYADGTKDSLGYYPCGCQLQFKEDRNGEVTEYIYDERDRLEKKIYYDDLSDYNSSNPSDSLVYEYNEAGEIIKTTDKTGDIVYSWDDVGNLDTVKVYSLYENVYQYDLSGRKTHLKSYKYGTPGQVYLEQSWQYDDAGRDTSVVVEGNKWNLSYYDNNSLKEILYPEFYITAASEKVREAESYTIGKMGEIKEIFTVLNHNVTDIIDNSGFEDGDLTGWDCYPQAGANLWYIDPTDEIVEISCGTTHGTGSPVHSWQVTNSIAKEGTYSLYSPSSPTEPYSDVEFALQHFDLSDYGRPFEASCWIKTDDLEDGVWIGVILWVDYTDSIRVLAHKYSEKITGTNDWEKIIITIDDEYDVSNLKGIFYVERFRGDGAVWVDDITLQKGDEEQNAKVTYQYDQRMNRNYSYIKLPDGTEEEYIYRYDNLDRLKKTLFKEPGESPSLKYEYTYDPVGNRTEKEETDYSIPETDEYTYNYNTNNNQLLSITELGEIYTYNDRGDLLTATGGYTFSYDREGRLEEIQESSGGLIHKFKFLYSSGGRRIMKIDSSASAVDTTYYVYDGMYAIAELDGHLDLKSKYIYTNGMLVGKIDENDELFQYFHDGLGSITMICDSTGQYQNLYTYDDFGDFRKKSESIPNSYCYTGQERDEEPSGLYNLRARYYAAGMGRFTQEDPLLAVLDAERIQEFNGYTYVANNPINLIDPFGLCAQKEEDCRMVFIDCMLKNVIGIDLVSVMGVGQGVQYYFTTKAWQHAANRMLKYPLKSSIFRGKMALGKSLGSAIALAYVIVYIEICTFEEIECLQDNAYGILDQTYKHAYGGY